MHVTERPEKKAWSDDRLRSPDQSLTRSMKERTEEMVFYLAPYKTRRPFCPFPTSLPPMSFSRLLSSGRSRCDSRNEHTNAHERSLSRSIDNTTLDPDVLRRITHLSLSRPQVGASPDADEDSNQSPTNLFNVLASTPLSTGSGSVTSFDFDSHSLSEPMSSLSPQPSLYSLTDSLKEQSVHWEYGRRVNTHSEVYKLAADEEEAQRQGE